MFDFILKLYARIIRSITRATSAPAVAGFMLPPLYARWVGADAGMDFVPGLLQSRYRVFDWNMDCIIVQMQHGILCIERSYTPEPVWISTIDWIIARQSQ
jgi:hypothetical protein